MARTYFKHSTSIWRDDDFRDLTPEQQALYFLIGGQSEITAAGTVPLRPRRWAQMAKDWTVERIMTELDNLAAQGHVVVDEDTEEVLVVKFVKWDGGYTNKDKRLPVIRDTAMDIESPKLRRALAIELRALGLTNMASKLDSDTPPDRQSDSPSDTQRGSDRLRVTQGEYLETLIPTPQALSPEQESQGGEPSAESGPPSMFCSKHPEGTEEPCGPCATARARYAQHVKDTADREAEAKRTRAEAIAGCEHCDEHGRLLDLETGKPIGRCDHRRSA